MTRVQQQLSIRTDDGVILAGELAQEANVALHDRSIVLLHGLTATRRYVVMGSRTLERAGLRVIAYDARGHGRSSGAPDPAAYGYGRLAHDLLAVLDALELSRPILAGASMGAHTALAFARAHPERVAALGLITPAFDPAATPPLRGAGQDPLAHGLRERGVEGFVAAYDFSSVPEAWRETVEQVIRQRLGAHQYPEAVADALETVPRSRPFEEFSQLGAVAVPTVVVASRDEVDPGHPLALAERYARAIPGAELRVEDGGPPVRSPIAWQGGQLSKLLVELAERVGQY